MIEGTPESGTNHLSIEVENDIVEHWQISIFLSAICVIIAANQSQVVENGEKSHIDNLSYHTETIHHRIGGNAWTEINL